MGGWVWVGACGGCRIGKALHGCDSRGGTQVDAASCARLKMLDPIYRRCARCAMRCPSLKRLV